MMLTQQSQVTSSSIQTSTTVQKNSQVVQIKPIEGHTDADVQQILNNIDRSKIRTATASQTPVYNFTVFRQEDRLGNEVVHIVPAIHHEMHQMNVVTKDIYVEKHIIEDATRDVPTYMTEHVQQSTQVRDVAPTLEGTAYVQEQAIIEEKHIIDNPVLGRVVEHEKNFITREIHNRPLITKEIIHERPIIEREVKDNIIVEKKLVTEETIVRDMIPAERAAQREFVRDQDSVNTVVIQDKAVLVSEVTHEKPIVEREVHQKDLITKEIFHEQPVVERHLVETVTNQTQVLQSPTRFKQSLVIEDKIYKTMETNFDSSIEAQRL